MVDLFQLLLDNSSKKSYINPPIKNQFIPDLSAAGKISQKYYATGGKSQLFIGTRHIKMYTYQNCFSRNAGDVAGFLFARDADVPGLDRDSFGFISARLLRPDA